ncbi:MAG: vWA domain-containing protein [Magnetovibrionaceae bacterium]
MRPRRQTEGFNIAFLDIMSCGLGAVILVFMLVRQDVEPIEVVEAERLAAELAALEAEEAALDGALTEKRTTLGQQEAALEDLSSRLQGAERTLARERATLAERDAALSATENRLEQVQEPKPPDVVEKTGGGEETYIMGLRVEGPRIVLLVDASASMTDRRLIEIIKRKASGRAVKQKGPKWQRTLDILAWMLARVPNGSDVAVIAFADKSQDLSKGWVSGRDSNALAGLLAKARSLVPEGPTNLHAALLAAGRLRPSDVYVITDGLPTEGEGRYQGLNPFADCNSLFGKAATISGECRVQLFRHTIANSSLGASTTVNVVLLPLEGDPQAGSEFWAWTAASGGLLISPAESWP